MPSHSLLLIAAKDESDVSSVWTCYAAVRKQPKAIEAKGEACINSNLLKNWDYPVLFTHGGASTTQFQASREGSWYKLSTQIERPCVGSCWRKVQQDTPHTIDDEH